MEKARECDALITFLSNATCNRRAKWLLYFSDLPKPLMRCQLFGTRLGKKDKFLFGLHLPTYEVFTVNEIGKELDRE